ncbi:MAG TPA: DNA primase [Pelolinea sp.]|nr:DNA primase [Pelolinea sp.]
MNTVDEIKNRLDIVDIISENVRLRKSGKNYTGFCPFHANTRTPAFVVFADSGTWRCFGECNEGGDIFRYVMKREGWDFKEALKNLAERAGIKLEPLTPQRREQNERSDHLRKLLDDAVIFYRSQLTGTDPGHQALDYLTEKRGITEFTAEVWGIGYAPQSWDATTNYFLGKGYAREDILDIGLLTEKDDGGVYDKFRHRLMFPIRDATGGMAGFGGRVLNPDDVPKFMNSPQTILFDKSRLLYGLDRARKAIRTASQAVIVEGYMDVIVLHQQGFENVISPMGTALTEAQMRALKRYARRFVMALDPDAAGVKATLRGLEVARESLDRSSDLTFDARGLLHNEARLQADLRVSALPDELDPDEIVLRDPGEWQRIIDNAKPIIFHVLDTLTEGQNISDPKTKSDIAARILPLIKDVPNPVERDAYRQQVARVLQVDESALLMLTTQGARRPRRRRLSAEPPQEQTAKSGLPDTSSQQKIKAMERQVLAYLVKNPEQQHRVNRFLQEEDLKPLAVHDFSFTEHQQAVELIFRAVRQDAFEPHHFIMENLPEELDFILEENEEIKKDDQEGKQDQEKADAALRELEETIRLVMQLRQLSVNAQINQLRYIQSNQEEPPGQKDLAEMLASLNQLIKNRGLLDKALSKPILLT